MKQTILIIDDESGSIDILVQMLEKEYELLIATSGEKGLELLHNNLHVSLVLLDIIMPGLDGYEVACKLNSIPEFSAIPFIFLSANNDTQSIVKGFKHGAADYISKPVARQELLVRVRHQIEYHNLKESLDDSLKKLSQKVADLDKANSALSQNRYFLESILSSSPFAIITTSLDGTITLFNRAAQKLLGYTQEEVINTHTPLLFHSKSQLQTRIDEYNKEHEKPIDDNFTFIINSTKESKNGSKEWLYHTKDHEALSVRVSISDQKDADKNTIGYIGMVEDITQIKRDKKLINDYINLIDKNVLTSTTDLDGVITEVSQAFCKLTGYTRDELIGNTHRMLKDPDCKPEVFKELWQTITQNKVWTGTLKSRTKSNQSYYTEVTIYPIFDFDETKIGYTSIRKDVTDKKHIQRLSITDELTTLYNRRYFNEIFNKEFERLKSDDAPIGFLMLDVDYFKPYNDNYGHEAGDTVLQTLGETFKGYTRRTNDWAFRLGGEEFGILFNTTNMQKAHNYAQTLLEEINALNIEHKHSKVSQHITVSIGLVFQRASHFNTPNDLYKKADTLLYEAKEQGRNRIVSNEDKS